MLPKNLHLQFSIGIVLAAGLAYGVSPNRVLPLLFDFRPETPDLHNVFRAVWGLYWATAFFWWMGIRDNGLWRAATMSNVAFMGGLAAGRLVSMAVDGLPSGAFAFGFFGEAVLAVWGLWNLRVWDGGKSC